MFLLNAEDHPALKEVIQNFQHWDRKAVANSKGAAIFLLVYEQVGNKLRGTRARLLTKQECLEAYQYVYDDMMKNFGRTDLTLGDIQKLVRGDDARPMWGLPDILTAAYTSSYKNGMRKVISGDAYICLVRYPKDGSLPIIESVNTFGASMHPDSPHYKDQMQLFIDQKLKKMSLSKEEVMKHAEKVYHPG
jgi:acyl-homoserine-lactone acylase